MRRSKIWSKSISFLCVNDADAKFVRVLLSILDISYAMDYNKWFNVLCCIANININYKILAIDFSQRCMDKWDLSDFETKWREAEYGIDQGKTSFTIRSLMFWAKLSNKLLYEQTLNNNYSSIVHKNAYKYLGKIEHYHVAEIMYLIIQDKYVVSKDPKSNKYTWYEFVFPGQPMKHGQIYKWRCER